ncbi:MAG: hypothetical protein ACTHK3_04940 [Solirubrobacterales bacterium]
MTACAICGRSILAGERVHGYVEGEEERPVCELCLARAERLGWRQAGEPEPERPQGHEGRARLRGLLRRSSPSLDADAPTPFECAIARFNSSEAGHTVTGLIRTLGSPWVSVGASAGVPDEVRITVAWELSWYQWGVDIGDELRPVFQLDKGRELDQLDHAARQWNGTVGEDGRLRLAREPAARR